MRGIVITPEIEIFEENGMYIKDSNIHPLKLREYLLYWDKIDFPTSNIITFGGSPEIYYLQEVGVLKRSRVNLNESGEMVDLFLKSQMQAYLTNNDKDKGSWSIVQPNFKLALPTESSIQTRALEIELYNSLPIPKNDVPLEEILEFKQRRNDELKEFRYLMDSLYEEILKAQDTERAIEKNIDLIQRKVIDIHRVMEESRIKRIFGSVKVNLSLSDAIKQGLIWGTGGAIFSFPVELGALLGTTASFIKVDTEVALQPKILPPELKDYAYLYYTQKEFA